MNKSLEIEYKLLITKKQYETIINNYPSHSSYVQINYYFDTFNESLRKKRYMLRIRKKDHTYEFTLKKRGESIIGVDEYNEIVDDNFFQNLKNHRHVDSQILDMLSREGICIDDLQLQHQLKTTRLDIPYANGVISIDKNEYLDTVDYEIEYEVSTSKGAISIFNKFLAPYHLTYISNCAGKRHRLYELVNLQNNNQ